MNLTTSETSAERVALQLVNNFRLGTLAVEQPEIVTSGLFDFTKVKEVLARGGVNRDQVNVAPFADSLMNEKVLEAARSVHFSSPAKIEHYIHSKEQWATRDVVLRTFRDCYLSFDISAVGAPQYYLHDASGHLINGHFFGASPFVDLDTPEWVGAGLFVDDAFIRPNICHYLYDKLPLSVLGLEALDRKDDCKVVIVNDQPFMDLAERIFGFEHYILGANGRKRGTIRFSSLSTLSTTFRGLNHPANYGNPDFVRVLRDLRDKVCRDRAPDGHSGGAVGRDLGVRGNRYILMRKSGAPRQISNWAEISKLVHGASLEIVDPAEWSEEEQIVRMARTELLVGVHGAGLTHLAFLPPNACVVELLPPLCATPAYWMMAGACGVEYRHVLCHDPELGRVDSLKVLHDGRNNRRDIRVPPDDLRSVLTPYL